VPQSLPVIFLACTVFERMVNVIDGVSHILLDYGLHAAPKNLNIAVQTKIDLIPHSSLIVLGYGLCGKGLTEFQEGKHTLVIPKGDNCAAIFAVSSQRYLDQVFGNNSPNDLTKGL
jgi:hypothetical protein